MKSLWESLLDSDTQIQKNIQSEYNKQIVKEALIEFFKHFHIDVPNKDNTLNIDKDSKIHDHLDVLRYNMRNFINWVTEVPQHGNDQWFQEKTWEGMLYTNQNWIREALREDFEKYLNRRHVKFYKRDTLNKYYDFGDFSIEFWLYRNESKGAQKEYNKQTRGGKERRDSYKSYGWTFCIIIPQGFWKS